MRLAVDPWARIEFYVRNGLVKTVPTAEQLKQASRGNINAAGPIERIRHYSRHPLDLFPTKTKRQQLLRMNAKAGDTTAKYKNGETENNTLTPLLDRILVKTFQFSPARFAVQCFFNPWNAIPGTGLSIPAKFLIAHVVHAPHPTVLWDVQIIHAVEGGLDQLEKEIERAATGRGLKPRIYRAMVQDIDYYDYVRKLIPRVRRFDYPPPPPGHNPIYENLVNFLNYAITL